MIEPTGFVYELDKLQEAIVPVQGILDENGTIELSEKVPGTGDGSYVLHEDFLGTTIEQVHRDIVTTTLTPYAVKRVLLFVVPAGRVQGLTDYAGYTYFVPITTNSWTFVTCNTTHGSPKTLKEGNCPVMLTYQLRADGRSYILDGTKFHYVSNVGILDTIFLLVETNRRATEQPTWTGLTTERMTGHHDFLETDLHPRIYRNGV